MYTVACKQVVKFWHSYNAFTGIKHTNSAQVMICKPPIIQADEIQL
jgi:hypothetical protein